MDLLIIMIKNSIKGKVKTRLARDIGEELAIEVYQKLLEMTFSATRPMPVDQWVLYSDFIDDHDIWSDNNYKKGIQEGENLGDRMLNAFKNGFDEGYQHICIIGSDCYLLDTETLIEAFDKLRSYDFVLGPSTDGGYYLLGMNKLYKVVFQNKQWSTSAVLKQTLKDINDQSFSCFLLKEFTDIDTKADLDLLKINLKDLLK